MWQSHWGGGGERERERDQVNKEDRKRGKEGVKGKGRAIEGEEKKWRERGEVNAT